MTLLNPNLTGAQWQAAMAASERLWPEPALAPDVPPAADLVRYLEAGPSNFRPAWLREQINESAASQRALEDLRLRRKLGQKDRLTEALLQSGFRIAPRETAALTSLPAEEAAGSIRQGDLHRTKGRVFTFGSGGLETRQTYRPLLVAIIAGPLVEGDQEYWRAVPCTPAASWPEEDFADDEILIRTEAGHDYVAHLWLEFPVAAVQIAAKVVGMTDDALQDVLFARDALAEGLRLATDENVITGTGLDPAEDAATFRKRAQLHDCARWLSTTLDALIAYDDWQISAWRAREPARDAVDATTEVAQGLALAAAAGRGVQTACAVWPGPLASFRGALAPKSRGTMRAFHAKCVNEPERDEEECAAHWQIGPEHAALSGRRFAIFDPASARMLGNGVIEPQGEGLPLLAKLTGGLWKDFEGKRAESMVLLIPEVW